MRMGTRNRLVSALMAVGYLLTVSAASLFHNHADHRGGACSHEASSHGRHGDADDHSRHPQSPSPCSDDGSECSVCQFLAQKPAPTIAVVVASSGALVQDASVAPPARVIAGVFSAWHSRGPPSLA
jgi:hypothetical protein